MKQNSVSGNDSYIVEQITRIQCLTDRHIPHRRLFRIDAIGIWVLAGKSIEEWLKIKAF